MLLNYLKLLRARNLLIIAVTQYLIRYAVILPMLKHEGYVPQFSHLNFFLLVLTTMIIAAAGYVINDYFDTKTDILNHPKTVVVGKYIKRRTAMTLHVILNIVGVALGLYISYQINIWKLVYIYVLITGLLWFYSTSYKRQFLVGNLIVSILTALVPLMVVLYEIPPLNSEYAEILLKLGKDFYHIFFWVLGFTIFAFITTMTREILKDVEDFEGDRAYGRRTLPVVSGIMVSKIVTISLTGITIVMLIFSYFKYLKYLDNIGGINFLSAIYVFIFLICPSLFLIYRIIKADKKENWHFASNLSKIIMLFGVLYSFVILYYYSVA